MLELDSGRIQCGEPRTASIARIRYGQGTSGTAPAATRELAKPLRLQHRTRWAGDEGLVPQNGPPDWGIGETSSPRSSPHAAPWLWFQAGERWRRYPRAAALPGPPQYHAHGAVYRAALRPL